MKNDTFDAVAEGNLNKLAQLIDSGCNPNAQDEESTGETLLTVAASQGNLEVVRFLVELGADVNAVNQYAEMPDEHSPLSAALLAGHQDVIDYLLPKTKTQLKKEALETALFLAVEEEDINLIQMLTNTYKVDVNLYDRGV